MVQQCIVHLIRNSFRCAGRQHRDAIVKRLGPVYTAPSEAAAKDRRGSAQFSRLNTAVVGRARTWLPHGKRKEAQ